MGEFQHAEAYVESLRFLRGLTDLERQPMTRATREQMDVARPAALLARLGSPQQHYRSILIAGSKGKGSTAVMLARVFQAAGHRTGLYSQPHLHSYRERIQVDGMPIPEAEFAGELARIKPPMSALVRDEPALGEPTAFEVTTALALDYFSRSQVEIAIVEVGLGGRLDATNAVSADLSIIMPIGYEHTAVLGNTLAEIAFEKAGIIKPGRPVLSAAQSEEALQVLERVAAERGATLGVAGRDWTWRGDLRNLEVASVDSRVGLWSRKWKQSGLALGLLGSHQLENAAVAVAAAEVMSRQCGVSVDHAAVAAGLNAARWPGRIEVLSREGPIVVADGAHTGDSAQKLANTLKTFSFTRLWLVLGVLQDKDVRAIIEPLAPMVAAAWTVQTGHPRSYGAVGLAKELRIFGVNATPARGMQEALGLARAAAASDDLILIAGSLSTAAEAREAWGLVPEQDRDPVI